MQDTNNMETPLVSLGMVAYNNGSFVGQAIESVLAQDYENFELIICDDGSTDATPDICREYAKKDRRIRFYQNGINFGATLNHKRVFHLSSGSYFMWAGDHDLWDPTFISKCLALLRQDPTVVLCYTRTVLIDCDNRPLGMMSDTIDTRGMSTAEGFKKMLWELSSCNMFCGLYRSSVMLDYLSLPDVFAHDAVFLGIVSLRGAIARIDEPLFLRRENRPGETPEQAFQRRREFVDAKSRYVDAFAPHILMSDAVMKSLEKGNLPDAAINQLAAEVMKSRIVRYGDAVKEEIALILKMELADLKSRTRRSLLDHIRGLQLLKAGSILKSIFISFEGSNLILAAGHLRMENLTTAEQLAMEELENFPESINAKALLYLIKCHTERS